MHVIFLSLENFQVSPRIKICVIHAFRFSFKFTLPLVETFYEEKKKMSLRELLRKFFIVGCNLNGKLVAVNYLSRLSDNDEENYKVFERFSRECSNTLLCIMHRLGHYGDDEMLAEIISRHLEVRIHFEHEEDDVGGHIADFMQRIQNRRERGK